MKTIVALFFITLILFSCSSNDGSPDSNEAESTDNIVLPDERVSYWRNAGVQGGIPDYPVGVDVTNYGAIGDGTTDDTSAIQAAIDACPSEQAVYFPAGDYLTTETLSISSSIVLRGESSDTVRILHDHTGYAILVEDGGDWAGLEDLHVETIYYFTEATGTKILFQDVQNSWIRNIETSGYLYHAISLTNCSYCEVRDNYVHNKPENAEDGEQNSAYGIQIMGWDQLAAYNLVENNILDWFRHAIILQRHCMNNVVAYNFCWTTWSCQTTGCGYSLTTDIELHHPDYDDLSRAIYFTLIEGNLSEHPGAQNNNHNNNNWFRNRINNGGLAIMTDNIAFDNEFTEKKRPETTSTNNIGSIHGNSLMHGNYFTESPGPGIIWDDSIADRTFPDSYYLEERPEWFDDLDWPPYGGDLMPGNTRRNPAEVRYWTMLYPEETPSNLQANLTGDNVVLTWDNNSSNDVDFVICRSTNDSDYYRIGETTGTTYTDTVPEAGTYYYYIRSRNYLGGVDGEDLGGESDPSQNCEVTIP